MKQLKQVGEFHDNFKCNIGEINKLTDLNERQLRIKLIFEELSELAEASDCRDTFSKLCEDNNIKGQDGDNTNQTEELDALCDLSYVVNGTVISYGLHDIFEEAFDEVHNSNMTKLSKTEIDAINTVNFYENKGQYSDYTKVNGGYLVNRIEDNKVLKSVSYQKARLDELIEKYLYNQ